MNQEVTPQPQDHTPANQHRQSFGPWPHCTALLWQQLVDFENWPDWWRDVQSVQQLDKGEPGRGSQLQVNSRFDQQIWEIIYWQSGSRVDFEILDRHCRAGLSLSILPGSDNDHAILTLDMEFIPLTSAKLMAFLAQRGLRRRGLRLLKSLAEHLQEQQPAWD
ncbi:MAG: SRPBCC family protein [Pseudohongiellaceae bacterium]|jgi:hypothetical protein